MDQERSVDQNLLHHHHVITVEEPNQEEEEEILSSATVTEVAVQHATSASQSQQLQQGAIDLSIGLEHQHPPISFSASASPFHAHFHAERIHGGTQAEPRQYGEDNQGMVIVGETEMVDLNPTEQDVTTHAANYAAEALPQILTVNDDPRPNRAESIAGTPARQQTTRQQQPHHPTQPQPHQQDTVEINSATDKTQDTDEDSLLVATRQERTFHHPLRNNPSHPSLTRSIHAAVMATTHIDDDLLIRAMSDAGRWAFGTMLVELWVMSDDKTKLFRPPGGWWLDPTYYEAHYHQPQDHENESASSMALRQLFDPSYVHYEEPHPVSPSVGLAGVLWTDVEYAKRSHPGNFLAAATNNLAHVLDRSRNRGASQHGDSVNGSRHSGSVNGSRHRQGSIHGIIMNVLDRSRHRGAAGAGDSTLAENAATAAALEDDEQELSPQQPHPQHSPPHQPNHHRPVAYRDLEAIAMDPDQPYHRRIDLLLRCGLTSAAAVAFDTGEGHEGIVIFMTHHNKQHRHHHHHHHTHSSDTAEWRKFQSLINEAYWRAATDMIGAVYAMRGPRRAMVAQRQDNIDKVLRRLRTKLLCLRFMGIDTTHLTRAPAGQQLASSLSSSYLIPDGSSTSSSSVSAPKRRNGGMVSFCITCCSRSLIKNPLMEKTVSVYHKCYGGNVPPPPPFTWEQTMWTFFGVFTTLLMLTRLNEYLLLYYGGNFEIVLGPFGALMTLLYGLSAAPASQPRNVVLGQAVALVVSVSIAYAHDYLPLYLRQGLATAIAVAAMVKLGITHPPAGASALLFSSGDYGWMNVAFMLVGNIMAVIAATIINNMSDKRQYPIYWGLQPLLDLFQTTEKKKQ